MAKSRGVLGNDPFQRGAAARAPEKTEPEQAPPASPPVRKKTAGAAKAKPARPRAPRKPPAPEAEVAAPPAPTPVQPPAPAPAPAPEPVSRTEAIAPRGAADAFAPVPVSAAAGLPPGIASSLLRALKTGLGASGSSELDPYGMDPKLVEGLDPLRSFLYERYWRVSVQGAEHLPAGPVLLVANHSGALPFDGPVLQEALRRSRPDAPDARWLVEDQVFFAPIVGTLLNRLGAVRACPENAVRLLGEGRPVMVFPEGIQGIGKPFRDRYRLMRFGRGGVVKIALRTRAPIVPVAIVGAEESMPLLGRIPARSLGVPYVPVTSPIPLPARWSIRFGEPMNLDRHGPDVADDLPLVNGLNDRLRESVQGMVDDLLRQRTSVFS